MARRTIDLTIGFENAVCKLQALMVLSEKRDITFSEALHKVLSRGFIGGEGPARAWWKGEPHCTITEEDWDELFEGDQEMLVKNPIRKQ